MTEMKMTTSTDITSSDVNNTNKPFYLLYPTPTFDREELHKTVSPLLTDSSFNGKQYMSNIAITIAGDHVFDKVCGTKQFYEYRRNRII